MHACRRLVVIPAALALSLSLSSCTKPSSGPSSGSPSGLSSGGDGKASAAKDSEPVARVGDEVVTVDDLQKKLDEQSPFIRARYAEMDKRKELLDAQVRFEVLAAEAAARGYENDPEIKDAVKKLLVQRLTREEFDGRVQLKDITDGELQKYFDDHKGDYQKPEMVRASVITVVARTPDAKAKADEAARLAADPKKKDDRVFFKDLVTKYSTDETTKPAGGDVRYVSADEAASRFGKEAAAWLFSSDEANAVSPVFSSTTPAGQAFHVFKRTGKRKAIERSFDQVKNQIKNVVYREKRTAAFNAFVDELKTKHHAVTFPEKLEQLKIPVLPAEMAGAVPGALPGALPGVVPDGVGNDHGDDEEPTGSGAPSAAPSGGAAPPPTSAHP
jgi:peptidyl-prolyl cis-trans isomerase C